MTGAMGGSVAFVLFLIYDLDNPFWGDWRVTPRSLLFILDQDPRKSAVPQVSGRL